MVGKICRHGSAAADSTRRERAVEIEASFELAIVHVVAQLWVRLGIDQAIAARMAADERHGPHGLALLAKATRAK